jgi:IS30 family transposase
MKYYNRLSLEERGNINHCLKLGMNITKIAKNLNRSKSTISREIKRGTTNNSYCPVYSEERFISGLSRNKALFLGDNLRNFVIDKIVNCRWSPAAIAGRLKAFPALKLKASYETIYKFVFSTEGIALNLPSYLKRKKKVRGLHYRKAKRNTIIDLKPISTRPEYINNRSEFGHFEADLLIISGVKGTNIISIIERKTRWSKLIYNQSKGSNPVISKINSTLGTLSEQFKSITFDRGKEFAKHHELPAKTFFCNPHSPWQKGAVENLNGRIRALMPKNCSIRGVSTSHIDWIENIINNTPLKVLGYLTPLEALHKNAVVALDP